MEQTPEEKHQGKIIRDRASYHRRLAANPERVRAIEHRHNTASRQRHRARLLAKNRLRYQARSETTIEKERLRLRATHAAIPPEVRRAKHREWSAAHPDNIRTYQSRRRARKAAAPMNDLTAEEWTAIQAAFDYRCAYCPPTCHACKSHTHVLTQDHVTLFAHNGSHTLWNVVPACVSCNSKKGTGSVLRPVQPLLLVLPAQKKQPS